MGSGGKPRKGFTLAEMIIGLAIMGIMAAIAMPMVSRTKDAAALSEAKAKAQILNCAKEAYKIRVGTPDNEFDGAESDERRFELLLPYLSAHGSSDYRTFCPQGYRLNLGPNIETPVRVSDARGHTVGS